VLSAGPANGASRRPPIQSVDRAVALLKAVAAAGRPATPAELAAACGLNRTTAWRLLSTLELHGLVEREPGGTRFTVGYGTVQLAAAVDSGALVRHARPALERLLAESDETVTLAVPRHFTLEYVDQLDPPPIPNADWRGQRLALHATSGGKAYLAWLTPDERAALLDRPLQRYTEQTVTDRRLLEADARQTFDRGYAICIGEYQPYSNGVAAPVLDDRGRPVALVSVWGPEQRIPVSRLDALGEQAIRAASAVQQRLG
jgi:DNA-binding IclR family transcriptional regulator